MSVAVQPAYDEYLQRQVDHYQDYLRGTADAIGHDMEVAEGPTRVIGDPEAAQRIGLSLGETPTPEAITRLGRGCHAQTDELLIRRWVNGSGERIAYHDLVFSVPKSVSVEFAAARAAGDEQGAQQLIEAMAGSVDEAIRHFQELVPLGRRRMGREGVQVAVPAKVVALMDVHSAARPVAGQTSGDPQLHVHTRLLNLGLQPKADPPGDGRPPVASVNYLMLYQHVRALNGLFEAGLRSRLEELGYPTVSTEHGERRKWSSFELERQDEALSARLSSRQARVEALVQEEWQRRQSELLAALQIAAALRNAMGTATEPVLALTQRQRSLVRPTQKQAAALSRVSREAKLATTRAELAEEWGRVIAEHGYRHLPSDPGAPSCRPDPHAREREMARITRSALARGGLVAGRSVFDRGDILELVSSRAVAARLDASELRRTVERVEEVAVRLEASVHEPLGAFTTVEQLGLERAAVEVAVAMADEATVSVPHPLVSAAITDEATSSGRPLDAEQEAAVHAFCSPSGWVQLVGVAGSGKTTVCRPAIQALQQAGYQVLGVSLSQGATDVLGAETGIPTWNLADFLVRVEHTLLRTRDGEPVSLTPRTVILVDEAGTVDSATWHAFSQLCARTSVAGVRILGDPEQTQPVGSGSILSWLARHLPTSHLTVNYRQGDDTAEAEAARLLRDGKGGGLPPAQGPAGPALDRHRQRDEHHPGGGDVGQGHRRGRRPEAARPPQRPRRRRRPAEHAGAGPSTTASVAWATRGSFSTARSGRWATGSSSPPSTGSGCRLSTATEGWSSGRMERHASGRSGRPAGPRAFSNHSPMTLAATSCCRSGPTAAAAWPSGSSTSPPWRTSSTTATR